MARERSHIWSSQPTNVGATGGDAKQEPLRHLSPPQLPSQHVPEVSWPWVASWIDQLKNSEIRLGKEFLSLAPDPLPPSPLFSSRLGSENRLIDQAVVSTLSSYLAYS